MRELKFRAWLPKKVPWWDLRMFYSRDEHDLAGFFSETHYDGTVYMQFTGLLDKNGKEIYEGDIVRHLRSGRAYPIIFNLGKFGCDFLGTPVPPIDSEFWEVIGNIYENPELLTSKKKEGKCLNLAE